MNEKISLKKPTPTSTSTRLSNLKPAKKHRVSIKPHDWAMGNLPTASSDKALWIAVISRAMLDAISTANDAEQRYHRQEAIAWLTGGGMDFHMVCLMAGMEPSEIRRKAKHAISNPRPWRAAPRTGARFLERLAYRQKLKSRKEIHALDSLRDPLEVDA